MPSTNWWGGSSAAGGEGVRFIIINPAAFTHTSVALRDALLATGIPFIELHLSNVHAREAFRRQSYFSDVAVGVICGLGPAGYRFAYQAALEHAVKRSGDGLSAVRAGPRGPNTRRHQGQSIIMDIRKVKKLIELVEESDIDELEIREAEESVRISRHRPPPAPVYQAAAPPPVAAPAAPAGAPAPAPAPAESNAAPSSGHVVTAPMVGTFYQSPAPGQKPFRHGGPGRGGR